MMVAVRVNEKGQITLSARIRRALGIKAGDYVKVSVEKGCAVIAPQSLDDALLPVVKLSAAGERMLAESMQAEREGRAREFDTMDGVIAELKREAGLD